jgi:hypothetical protein
LPSSALFCLFVIHPFFLCINDVVEVNKRESALCWSSSEDTLDLFVFTYK